MTNDDRPVKDKQKMISNEELFINLVGLDEVVLTKIAKDLHIKTD